MFHLYHYLRRIMFLYFDLSRNYKHTIFVLTLLDMHWKVNRNSTKSMNRLENYIFLLVK